MTSEKDLEAIGAHCHLCRQKDFLPHRCLGCQQIFCSEHWRSHQGTQSATCGLGRAEMVEAVLCPSCGKDLLNLEPLSEAAAKQLLAAHYRSSPKCSGASRAPTTAQNAQPASSVPSSFRCCATGCKTKELFEIRCDKCRQHYCLAHRFPDQHSCSPDSHKTTAARPQAPDKGCSFTCQIM